VNHITRTHNSSKEKQFIECVEHATQRGKRKPHNKIKNESASMYTMKYVHHDGVHTSDGESGKTKRCWFI